MSFDEGRMKDMGKSPFGNAIHILGEQPLLYCPTDEWIFPSVTSSAPFGAQALGNWYMYYSPHDAPGGVCLAYADSLAGPWIEYPKNPVIANVWEPHYRVSHVASPHPLWIPEHQKLFLWFHGENNTTRYASSDDGIHFHYQGVAITQKDKPELMEISYARVFRNPGAESTDPYIMLYMGKPTDQRFIYVARSQDAHVWTLDDAPLVIPPPQYGQNTSGPWLWTARDRTYVLHHIDRFVGPPENFDLSGNFYATEVTSDLNASMDTHLLYESQPGHPDNERVADIQLVKEGERMWMFYIGGRRLRGRIYARIVNDAFIQQVAGST